MKDNVVMIMLGSILAAIVILGIILVALFNQGVAEIKNEVINNGSSVFSQVASVNGTVSTMMQNIQVMLDKQSSLLAGYTVTYGNIDAKALKCDVTVSVTPKVFSPDMFVALYIGDQSALMTQNGNAYTATVAVPITDVYENVSVTFEKGGISQTEVLPAVVDAGGQLLSSFYLEPQVNTTYLTEGSIIDGSVSCSVSSDSGEDIASIRIVAEQDGKELWSQNTDHPKMSQPISFSHTYKADFPEEIMIYVDITGSSGLKYRYAISGYYKDSNDGIYDADGKLIRQYESPL